MTASNDPKKWAVSRARSLALAKTVSQVPADNLRYQTLSNTLRELTSEGDVLEEVGKLWREAQEKFLTIGRYLVRARETFRGSYEAAILPYLPFGRGVAYQLRAVAVAVDEGRLLEDELPNSYATAYQLVSLEPAELAQARSERLVRPDVLRREVEAFRSRIRQGNLERSVLLQRERDRLRREVRQAEARLDAIDRELSTLAPATPIAPKA